MDDSRQLWRLVVDSDCVADRLRTAISALWDRSRTMLYGVGGLVCLVLVVKGLVGLLSWAARPRTT